MGRFISPDELSILDETKSQINGLNLYMYCGNNPVMNIDSSGQDFWGIFKSVIGVFVGVALAVVAVASVIVTGGATLIPVVTGAVLGAGSSLLGQGIGNVLNGKSFFEDISVASIIMSGLAGAALGTGVGGFWGAVAIGSSSNLGTACLENKGTNEILLSTLVGGIAGGVGYGIASLGKLLVYGKNPLTYMDYYKLGRIDTNAFKASLHAIRATWYKFLPSIFSGAAKGIINKIDDLLI